MRPDVIIDSVPFLQLSIVTLEQDRDLFHFIKLFPMRSVRPLDITLQLRRSRGDNEQTDRTIPASLLKVFLELRSPIDLDRPDWEGELLFHIFQEDRRREARGSPKRPAAVPARDGIPGAVLVTGLAVAEPNMDGIDLDEVSGGINPISLGLAHGVTRLPAPLPGLSGQTDVERFDQYASLPQSFHDPTDRGRRGVDPFPPQEDRQLVFSPPGIRVTKG